MRRTIALLTIAALGFAGPTHADSVTVPAGTITVPAVIFANDTCVDIPVSYAFDGMDLAYSWALDLKTAAAGNVFDSGDGGDSGTAAGMWCPVDLPGSFSLIGTLTTYDENYQTVGADPVWLDFTVKKRTTRATIRVPDATPKAGKPFHIRGCVTAAGKREDYRDVTIQYRKPGGDWTRLISTSTDAVGCYDEEAYMIKPGKRHIRVRVPATNSRYGAYSKVLPMNAHR